MDLTSYLIGAVVGIISVPLGNWITDRIFDYFGWSKFLEDKP